MSKKLNESTIEHIKMKYNILVMHYLINIFIKFYNYVINLLMILEKREYHNKKPYYHEKIIN